MAGHIRRSITPRTFERWRAEGRGAGEGRNYLPWFTVQDVSSTGHVSRILGWKTHRQHHLLSSLETSLFYVLEWAPAVIDIREQFPLPLNTTLQIAAQLGMAHPRIPRSKDSWVMTTDIVVTLVENGRQKLMARAIKPSSELARPRVVEKLELERAFWVSQGIDWGLVTEKEIDPMLVENIKYVHPWRRAEDVAVPAHRFDSAESLLLDFLSQPISLTEAASAVDDRLGFRPGESLQLVRHFIANRRWQVDMCKRIDPSQRLIFKKQPHPMTYECSRQHAA